MSDEEIARRLRDLEAVIDPSERSLEVALLVGEVFRDEGHEMVLVGGSAIEFYTEGLYVSGDIDLCFRKNVDNPDIDSVMSRLGRRMSGRHFDVANCFVEILGTIESDARTEFTVLENEFGEDVLFVDMVEELVAERVYRADSDKKEKDIDCAFKLLKTCVLGNVEVDWQEVRRLLKSGLYRAESALDEMLDKVVKELDSEL